MIRQASVNHSSIAELLSQKVADLTDRVAACAKYLIGTPTDDMKRQLSNMYSLLFGFYRTALSWFLKSSTSRFLDSFNKNLEASFQDSARKIEDQVSLMQLEADAAKGALLRAIWLQGQAGEQKREASHQEVKGLLERHRFEQRQLFHEIRQQPYLAGQEMGNLLLETFKAGAQMVDSQFQAGNLIETDSAIRKTPSRVIEDATTDEHSVRPSISREDARRQSKHLDALITGDTGSGLLARGSIDRIDREAQIRVESMLADTDRSRSLWISGPVRAGTSDSAQSMALLVVASAIDAGTPSLSHFCEPRTNVVDVEDLELTSEEAGLLSVLYSFIRQLLQFSAPTKSFESDRANTQAVLNHTRFDFNKLGQNRQCWPKALDVLRSLLDATPGLRLCVLHGLNDLENLAGYSWCHDLLELLAEYQAQASSTTRFHILLTTSGQSRVLGEAVDGLDRYQIRRPSRRPRRGKKRGSRRLQIGQEEGSSDEDDSE